MLSDDKTLKTLKDEYKKRVINTEEASDNLKTNIGKRIIALALTIAFGSGIISLVASMSKKPVINPTNPTISTTNPTTPTTRPTSPTPTTRPADPTIPSSSPETILPNHEKLANDLVGPNLSKDELEKLVMYINISDYTNTNISISVEDLYTNYTNCIDEILNYDLQNSSKLRLSSVINNTTQKDCLKTIEDYRNKIYSTTDESKLISYYNDLVKYLESNKMNEVTSSVSIIAINEMYIYANNFFNDEIFALRDKLIEYTSVNKQDVINECYDVLNDKKLSEVSYTRLLTRI